MSPSSATEDLEELADDADDELRDWISFVFWVPLERTLVGSEGLAALPSLSMLSMLSMLSTLSTLSVTLLPPAVWAASSADFGSLMLAVWVDSTHWREFRDV